MKEKKEELTLTVLAAGMGSRFGGLKQLEPVGPNGEFIIDYTVYDAIKAGFDKVVFIIRKEFENEFKNTIGARIEPFINVEYAYQDMKDVPAGVEVPEERTKPLGTSQALWCARNNINGKFAIVSADDFYGRDALIQAANHAKNSDDFSIIGYKIGDTLSNNGSVKRGICLEENGHLQRIVESKVERKNGVITCEPLNGEASFTVEENHPVSMLLTTVDTRIIPAIEQEMPEEAKKHQSEMNEYEFLFPDTIDRMMQNNKVQVKVVPTDARWFGITYREDLETFKASIGYAIDEGIYPANLWGEKNNIKKK